MLPFFLAYLGRHQNPGKLCGDWEMDRPRFSDENKLSALAPQASPLFQSRNFWESFVLGSRPILGRLGKSTPFTNTKPAVVGRV